MAKYSLLLCIFAAQSACGLGAVVNLRSTAKAQSNASTPLIFSQSIWNNTITNYIQHEVHMQESKTVNKAIWVFLTMFPLLNMCGCDRCFMGQITLGVIKALTFGGCGIMYLVDFWTGCIHGLSKTTEIDFVMLQAKFEKDSIEPAFYVSCIFLCLTALQFCIQIVALRANIAMQQQILAASMEQQRIAAETELEKAKAANKEAEKTDSNEPGIARRTSQTLLAATMPTALSKGLRNAGFLSEKPSMPELIAAFQKMDKNGDGQLDREEIVEGMKALGSSDEHIDEMIKCADTDGDGKISKDEFLVALSKSFNL